MSKQTYYQKNKEKIKAYKEANFEAQQLYYKKYSENNRDKVLNYQREYAKNNPKKCAAKTAKRHAAKLQQTPKWADLKAIEAFYLNCPEGYHVDHVIPLQGKNVRGLHTLENLQYLPILENKVKSNKFIL